jgi:hypothetical protein
MSSVFLFSAMAALGIISLFVASLTSTLAAYAAQNSIYYSKDNNIGTAREYLTISFIIGWISFILLLITLITAWAVGGFEIESGAENILFEDNPTRNELVLADKAIKKLSAEATFQFYITFVLVVIVLAMLAMTILLGIAASYLALVNPADNNVNSAYSGAAVGAVAAVASLAFIVVAIMAYASIMSLRAQKVEQFKTYEKYGQSHLGISRAQIEVQSQIGVKL